MAYLNQMSDDELDEWRKKQVDRCMVENTINKLIEYYGVLEQNSDIRLYDERSQNLEESAILMAISEHGLHQTERLPAMQVHGHEQDDRRQSSSSSFCGSTSGTRYSRPVDRNFASSSSLSSPEYSDESSSDNGDSSNLLEAAVSVAIQNQGLGLSGINR